MGSVRGPLRVVISGGAAAAPDSATAAAAATGGTQSRPVAMAANDFGERRPRTAPGVYRRHRAVCHRPTDRVPVCPMCWI